MTKPVMYKVLIERDGEKLLFVEGPMEMVGPAVVGMFTQERKTSLTRRTAVLKKFTPEEDARLIEAVRGGRKGPELARYLPARHPTSIRSRCKLLASKKLLDAKAVEAAIVNLATGYHG